MGGAPSQPAQYIESAPVPTPAPPVTSTSKEVVEAEQDYARDNLLKKSIKKTILAGDTGGYGATQTGPGTPSFKTKLG